jgi:lipoprotein-releasing system permease protein
MTDLTAAPPFGAYERTLAARYLRAKRQHGGVALISIISFVGIMLAVAVLIITMSVMNGFREELLSRILGISGHVFVDVSTQDPDTRKATVERARATPGAVHVAELIEGQALAANANLAAGALIRGLPKSDLETLSIVSDNVIDGTLDAFGQDIDGLQTVAIASRLAQRLSLTAGSTITFISPQGVETPFGMAPRRKSYLVGAIFSVGVAEFDEVGVFMPLEEAQLFFGRGDKVDRLDIRIEDPDDSEKFSRALRANLGNEPMIVDWRGMNASLVGALMVERNVMRLILMMIVAIAAMNIISGLVMLVKNKGRDIAILRTMGATRGAILRIFFMSGASVGVAGTFAGLVLGVLFCLNIQAIQDFLSSVLGINLFPADVYSLSGLPAKVEWGEVATVTGWALLMSFLATLPPAWRASRLDPVEALRYE